ncbi:MAG: hypothetical protein LBT91_00455, partial [Bifidobacteriaceae bacterium]|nr:hypothetical protein [Bifidobacteriaceae bacterium]
GTGEATAGNSTKLSANLAINPKYQYPYTLHGDNAFFLVLRVALTTTTSTGTNAVYSQALRITGIKHLHSSEPEMQQWVLVYNPKNASLDFSKSFYLYGYHASCKSNLSPAYAVLDKDAGVLTAWFYRPAYYNEPHIEWFYGYSSSWMWNGFTNYAKAIAVSNTNDRPEEALNIYPHCAAYTLPSPSPTPTPTPTETP